MPTCAFRFHGNLADFLPRLQRHGTIEYDLRKLLNLKDAIEAIGIPHVEIGSVRINGSVSTLEALPRTNDLVEVYPFLTVPDAPAHFVLDVHLGKLARLLRLLGFDTLCETNASDAALAATAAEDDRILLSRDIGLLKHRIVRWGYWLRSQDPEEQLMEVMNRFLLFSQITPFARCLSCNGEIRTVSTQAVWDQLPPSTQQHYTDFYQCLSCKKVYWKGSHYTRMSAWIEKLRNNNPLS